MKILGAGLALGLALLTWHRSAVWVSNRTLWASERPTPRMTANLAAALIEDGERAAAERWLRYGVRLSANPQLSDRDRRIGSVANLANLAIVYRDQGRRIDARLVAQEVQRMMPTWPMAAQLCRELGC